MLRQAGGCWEKAMISLHLLRMVVRTESFSDEKGTWLILKGERELSNKMSIKLREQNLFLAKGQTFSTPIISTWPWDILEIIYKILTLSLRQYVSYHECNISTQYIGNVFNMRHSHCAVNISLPINLLSVLTK